jgi:hypothetical protein
VGVSGAEEGRSVRDRCVLVEDRKYLFLGREGEEVILCNRKGEILRVPVEKTIRGPEVYFDGWRVPLVGHDGTLHSVRVEDLDAYMSGFMPIRKITGYSEPVPRAKYRSAVDRARNKELRQIREASRQLYLASRPEERVLSDAYMTAFTALYGLTAVRVDEVCFRSSPD